jgi:hypothetical protein
MRNASVQKLFKKALRTSPRAMRVNLGVTIHTDSHAVRPVRQFRSKASFRVVNLSAGFLIADLAPRVIAHESRAALVVLGTLPAPLSADALNGRLAP